MRQRISSILLVVTACAVTAIGVLGQAAQVVTLRSPVDKVTGKYDEGSACFSFKHGARKQDSGGRWDLGFGFMAIDNKDWFILSTSNENRSVIHDLGKLNWTDDYKVPVLEPLPVLPKGQPRHITVDASASTGKTWAATTNIFAEVIAGHLYVLHIKNEESDFYAMFRVEQFEQDDYCTVSWRLTPSPDPPH